MNTAESEDMPITYIKWNETDTDTIQAHYIRTENSIIYDQIWYNGILLDTPPEVTIIK